MFHVVDHLFGAGYAELFKVSILLKEFPEQRITINSELQPSLILPFKFSK